MVQRYEQTRKLQWYKRGAAYEQATNVEVDDLKVIADPKINYGGKTFGIDD